MRRMMGLWLLAALVAGCQARNPYAAFGPATIPAPGMQTPAPYYPAAAAQVPPAEPDDRQPSDPRPLADPADAQPIRIVENPTPIRTTAAPGAAAPSQDGVPKAAAGTAAAAGPFDPYVAPAGYVHPLPGIGTPAARSGWRAR
jgi:hypothetical protein